MSDREDLMAKLGLTSQIVRKYLGKIAWRRRTQIELRGNFPEKYPEDWLSAFLITGKEYFDNQVLVARKTELVRFKPYRVYSNGESVIFFPRVHNRRYIIGADPVQGMEISSEDTDFAAAVVLDLETGEEMAAYRAKVRPEQLAWDLSELGTYYNNAVIGVERTGDGGTTILTLVGDCKYGAIYKHKDWWKRQRQKLIEVEGFPTTRKTRPVALNFLSQFIMDNPELIWDTKFIDEAMVFVRDEKGIPKAMEGAHDDRVSARWIAHYVRRVLLGYYLPWEGRTETYTSADRLTVSATSAA